MTSSEKVFTDSSYTSHRAKPVNLQNADLKLFEHEFIKTFPGLSFSVLNNVYINDREWIFNGPKLSPYSFSPWDQYLQQSKKVKLLASLQTGLGLVKSEPIKAAMWITDPWSFGYFHWLMDSLPRLAMIPVEERTSRVLLLPAKLASYSYVSESLKAFPEVKARFMKPGELLRIENLLIPHYAAPTGNYYDPLMHPLRERYQHLVADRPFTLGDKIYISRSKAPRRKILNEDKLVPVLEKNGYRLAFLEDLPWLDQVAAFVKAKSVISLHGAGLTNMLFMNNGSKVLEIRRRDDKQNNCYFSLAAAMKIDYYYLLADATGSNTFNADFEVDLDAFRNTLDQLI